MATFSSVLLFCAMTLASAAMEGVSDNEDWAFQWYTGEPFRFKCQTSGPNITSENHMKWDTPTMKDLANSYDGTDYKVMAGDGISGAELLVKKVNASVHGVYTCYVRDNNGDLYRKVVYGLNIHDVKYHDMTDKYRTNIITAVVATAVFIVPFATTCFVWYFRYEEKTNRKLGKSGKESYNVQHEMKEPPADGIAATVESPEGKGAYENPDKDLSTQL